MILVEQLTWTFLLKQNFDVLHVFSRFIAMIETQFNTKILSVRYDNAHELTFTNIYLKRTTKFYHFCYETPKQNYVVEQKH